MVTTITRRLGPGDQGVRLSLAEYLDAEFQPGFRYELSRGVLVVADIPNRVHMLVWSVVRDLLVAYKLRYSGQVVHIGGGAEARLLMEEQESDRHPDLAVYQTPPRGDGRALWSSWVPELVIEIVSPGSEERDYVEKRAEYLAFGVKEYWIVDPQPRHVVVLTRRAGKWREQTLQNQEEYQTKLLPGFTLSVASVFAPLESA